MLTFITPAVLHFVRDVAVAVQQLAEFGLEALCDNQDHGHGHAIHTLGGDL